MYFGSNEELTDHLEEQGLLNEKLKKVFLKINRADFAPENLKNYAYEDNALPIGQGQTISQPTTVAFMLELLDVKTGNKILDIGAGSGWVSALLADLSGQSGRVYAFEINKTVGKFGRENIKKSVIKNVNYFIEDASKRWEEFAPYDRIYAGAGFDEIPEELKNLLKPGGILMAPTQDGNIRRIIKKEDGFSEEIFPGFVFVPFIKK